MILALVAGSVALATGPGRCPVALQGEPPQASVLTTAPGSQLFSAFGHSALRLSGGELETPIVVEWGRYLSSERWPIQPFLQGTLLYTTDGIGEQALLRRARVGDRSLVVQRLDLDPEQAAALHAELRGILAGDDRDFHYDWLRDNCATRVRDALDRATGGALRAQLGGPPGPSARAEVSRHLAQFGTGLEGWGAWGMWQLMAPTHGEAPLDAWEGAFLPDRLRLGLQQVQLQGADGRARPLVIEECERRKGGHDFAPLEAPRRGAPLLAVGMAWAGLVGLGATRARLLGGLALGALALVCGVLGVATSALALLSTHQGLGSNESWWVSSPASLALLGPAVALARGRVGRLSRALVLLLSGAGLLGLLRALTGLALQDRLLVFALFLPPLLAAALLVLRTPRGPHG